MTAILDRPVLPAETPAPNVSQRPKRTHWRLAVAVLTVVILADQATKWWAGHFDPSVSVNTGGDAMAPAVLSNSLADPLVGGVLTVVGALLIIRAVAWLARAGCSTLVRIAGLLVAAGWASNVVDRLGLRWYTAPKIVDGRGVVDWLLASSGTGYNLADLAILTGTLALAFVGLRAVLAGWRPRRPRLSWPTMPTSRRTRRAVLIAAAMLTIASAWSTIPGFHPQPPAAAAAPVPAAQPWEPYYCADHAGIASYVPLARGGRIARVCSALTVTTATNTPSDGTDATTAWTFHGNGAKRMVMVYLGASSTVAVPADGGQIWLTSRTGQPCPVAVIPEIALGPGTSLSPSAATTLSPAGCSTAAGR